MRLICDKKGKKEKKVRVFHYLFLYCQEGLSLDTQYFLELPCAGVGVIYIDIKNLRQAL